MRRDVPRATPPAPPQSSPVEGTWVLELPFTSPLSLNDRARWQVRSAQVRAWRAATTKLARVARIPACRAVTLQLWFTPRDDRRRDPLNLVASLKACEDGIVDAGVLPDDDRMHHTSVMPRITGKGPPRAAGNRLWLEVTVEPVESGHRGLE